MTKNIPLLLLSIFAVCCSPKDKREEDLASPLVSLSTPTNGQVFTGATNINITATITDDTRLAEIHVHISNQATGQLVADIHRYPNAASYSLNENFLVQAGISYVIRVLAIDRSGKEAFQTISIVVS